MTNGWNRAIKIDGKELDKQRILEIVHCTPFPLLFSVWFSFFVFVHKKILFREQRTILDICFENIYFFSNLISAFFILSFNSITFFFFLSRRRSIFRWQLREVNWQTAERAVVSWFSRDSDAFSDSIFKMHFLFHLLLLSLLLFSIVYWGESSIPVVYLLGSIIFGYYWSESFYLFPSVPFSSFFL